MTMNNNSSLSDLSTVNCHLSTKKIAVVILNWNGCKLPQLERLQADGKIPYVGHRLQSF